MRKDSKKTWLVLIHQIPPKPDYFRVKIWRRLQQIGAVAIKQSVYVLPNNESSYEDFSWVLKEIAQNGGDANMAEVKFLEGITDDQIVALFQEARLVDYEKFIQDVLLLRKELDDDTDDLNIKIKTQVGKMKKRLDDIVAIDYFESPQRISAENALTDLMSKAKRDLKTPQSNKALKNFTGKTWVTRKNIYVDRMASAWLIKRFIDQKAVFKFVETNKYSPQINEVRFDMFDAEFTHEGDMCTFEALIQRFCINDNALNAIAEIIHDIDLKDGKFGRKEVDGFGIVLSGITAAYDSDEEKLRISSEIFNTLYIFFKSKRKIS
ncbi:MAG: chromate resistance protein [Desulfobacterales bacterium]|nr:chromate resistance protein [Desulfobacterales bacterium]